MRFGGQGVTITISDRTNTMTTTSSTNSITSLTTATKAMKSYPWPLTTPMLLSQLLLRFLHDHYNFYRDHHECHQQVWLLPPRTDSGAILFAAATLAPRWPQGASKTLPERKIAVRSRVAPGPSVAIWKDLGPSRTPFGPYWTPLGSLLRPSAALLTASEAVLDG